MPDPFNSLRRAPDAFDRLPADEVRRRGDRLRRRRTTWQVLGSAAVVLALVGGIGGVLRASDDDRQPERGPATSTPSGSAAPAIPQDFPLTEDWQPSKTSEAGPVSFEACGRSFGAPPTDSNHRAVRYKEPDSDTTRELRTYPDQTAALEDFMDLLAGFSGCQGIDVRGIPGRSGAEVLRVDGGMGAAVILAPQGQTLLISISRQGCCKLEHVAEGAADDLHLLIAPIAAQCRLDATECGNYADQDADLEDSLLTTAELVAAIEKGLRTTPGPTWEIVSNRDNPTLDCQPDYLTSLEPSDLTFREWHSDEDAEAATAVMAFADEEKARGAYQRIRGWLADCKGRMAGARAGLRHGTDLQQQTTRGFEVSWRTYFAPLPEVCTGCGATWEDMEAVGLAGKRVVVLSTGRPQDLELVAGNTPTWPGRAIWAALGAL